MGKVSGRIRSIARDILSAFMKNGRFRLVSMDSILMLNWAYVTGQPMLVAVAVLKFLL